MKRILDLILLFTVLLMAGCNGSTASSEGDLEQKTFTPDYAGGFTIKNVKKFEDFSKISADSSKIAPATDSLATENFEKISLSTLISVTNPWQGATNVEQNLLLLRGEETAPRGFEGQIVHAPVQRVVCMSSTHIAMFDAIGEADRIVGVSGLDYVSSPTINQRRAEGKVKEIGFDTNIDFELIASLHPDLMLLFGITGENSVVTGKLRELGIPYIYIGDYVEESPLGKAEWMVLIAELCDKRAEGIEIFRGIADRYNRLKEEIAQEPTAKRPKVMLNTPYRDTWFMPSSKSYMIRLVEDAGGAYVYRNDENYSVSIDLEEAYVLAHAADVWINTGMYNTMDELKTQNPKFAEVPSVKNLRVWNSNRRQTPMGGSDFWESGVVRPDLVLRDLRAIFTQNGDSTTYYQPLR